MRYEQKRVAKPATTKCEADQAAGDITTILGTDELTSVIVAVWEKCANAPMCAAVSRRFKHASEQAKQLCKPLDVAPHRKQMKIAANDSMQPSAAADNATIESWGENFENFVPRSGILAPNMNDMQRILDVKGGGWLTNFGVDSYLSTFMPNVRAAMPGEPRVFLHSSTSVSLRATGTLGFKAELPSGETDVDRTQELCAHAKSVLLGAQETYVNYNVDDKHWGLIRVHSQFKRCEIFDSTGHLKKKHGRELLNGYELLTGVDTSDWAVVMICLSSRHRSGRGPPTKSEQIIFLSPRQSMQRYLASGAQRMESTLYTSRVTIHSLASPICGHQNTDTRRT